MDLFFSAGTTQFLRRNPFLTDSIGDTNEVFITRITGNKAKASRSRKELSVAQLGIT